MASLHGRWYDLCDEPDDAHVNEAFSHKLVCQLCEEIFEENVPTACVHFSFCKSCLEENEVDIAPGHGMVCTRCSVIFASRNPQLDSQQDVLNLMHLVGKCRRGASGNRAINSLCKELNEVLNVSSSTPSAFTIYPGGTKPCLGNGCKTCHLVQDVDNVTGPSRKTVYVKGNFVCSSKRVIYYIQCNICGKAYVGVTTQKLQDRMSQHCRDIKQRNARSSVANHFNSDGHTIENLKVSVITSLHPTSSRKTRMEEEKKMILFLGTIEPNGMNKG